MTIWKAEANRHRIFGNPYDSIYALYKHMYLSHLKKTSAGFERLRQSRISQVGISSITLSELEYGAAKSSQPEQNQIALVQFPATMKILSYGDEAAQKYGRLRAFLEKQGTPIGSLDMLIAAHLVLRFLNLSDLALKIN